MPRNATYTKPVRNLDSPSPFPSPKQLLLSDLPKYLKSPLNPKIHISWDWGTLYMSRKWTTNGTVECTKGFKYLTVFHLIISLPTFFSSICLIVSFENLTLCNKPWEIPVPHWRLSQEQAHGLSSASHQAVRQDVFWGLWGKCPCP